MKKILFFILFQLSLFSAQTQVSIQADKFEADENQHKTTFIDHVSITKNSDKIKAQKAIVVFDDTNKPIKYIISNNVNFDLALKKSTLFGTCDKLTFVPKSKVYTLEGNVKIDELPTKRKIQATKVIIDSEINKINITGEKNKPVKFIFEVEDK